MHLLMLGEAAVPVVLGLFFEKSAAAIDHDRCLLRS
jgi:hypothetical protein